jgi:hypothetical protein
MAAIITKLHRARFMPFFIYAALQKVELFVAVQYILSFVITWSANQVITPQCGL